MKRYIFALLAIIVLLVAPCAAQEIKTEMTLGDAVQLNQAISKLDAFRFKTTVAKKLVLDAIRLREPVEIYNNAVKNLFTQIKGAAPKIEPGSPQETELNDKHAELLKIKQSVVLEHITMDELDLDANAIPISVIVGLAPILDQGKPK